MKFLIFVESHLKFHGSKPPIRTYFNQSQRFWKSDLHLQEDGKRRMFQIKHVCAWRVNTGKGLLDHLSVSAMQILVIPGRPILPSDSIWFYMILYPINYISWKHIGSPQFLVYTPNPDLRGHQKVPVEEWSILVDKKQCGHCECVEDMYCPYCQLLFMW